MGEHARHAAQGDLDPGRKLGPRVLALPGPPHAPAIDAATPDHPVFVQRLDGHMALANSLALRLAGITRETPDRRGGTIVRDAQGEPTGS